MPFGVANAPALFQEPMNKILYILRRRPLVQELISRGAEMEAHIDDVSSGTNTQEDHVLLLCECFIFCQENHLRIKHEKCELMKEEMEYLGFDVGYGWWKPAASKMEPLQDMQIRDDPIYILYIIYIIYIYIYYKTHTPASTAPGTHGSRNPGRPLQRTGGRGRDSA